MVESIGCHDSTFLSFLVMHILTLALMLASLLIPSGCSRWEFQTCQRGKVDTRGCHRAWKGKLILSANTWCQASMWQFKKQSHFGGPLTKVALLFLSYLLFHCDWVSKRWAPIFHIAVCHCKGYTTQHPCWASPLGWLLALVGCGLPDQTTRTPLRGRTLGTGPILHCNFTLGMTCVTLGRAAKQLRACSGCGFWLPYA